MMLGPMLLIMLVLLLIGVIPSWSHSREWGYGPSGFITIAIVIVVILLFIGGL